ncbi:MAG: GNAT family N-acetyltransferase [Alphaproteobacteria bacterium]|nr:GNAT family N-acetyltransferase [Alphaproteobacteria bacterium]
MLPFNETSLPYAETLANLHKLCFDKPWDKAAFESLLFLPTTRGFVNDVAFILFSVCADQAEILTLGVVPDARKKGIAFDLLNYSIEQLKNSGVHEIFLDVNVKNLAARRLYEKADFRQVAVRKAYYEESGLKYDALVLKKIL